MTIRSRGEQRGGQALVEFSVSVILLLTVMCAIFEFSWVFYNYAYLNNIVSKAARLAVPTANTGNNTDAAITAFITQAQGGLPIEAPTFRLADASNNVTTSRSAGNILTVTALMNYSSITPLSNFVRMSSFGQLKASCAVVLE